MTTRRDPSRPPRTAALLTLAGATGTLALGGCSAGDARARPEPTVRPTAAPSVPSPSSCGAYADGDYAATGWYGGLPSHIEVDVTLRDDVVTAVVVTPTATDATSLDLQERFASAVAAVVVGRPLDEIELDRLAGSSGTTLGFNDALERIREQAAAVAADARAPECPADS